MVKEERMCVRYLAQCSPSRGWLINYGHDSNVVSAMVGMQTKC